MGMSLEAPELDQLLDRANLAVGKIEELVASATTTSSQVRVLVTDTRQNAQEITTKTGDLLTDARQVVRSADVAAITTTAFLEELRPRIDHVVDLFKWCAYSFIGVCGIAALTMLKVMLL